MDNINRIINFHNPNSELNHPHSIQKIKKKSDISNIVNKQKKDDKYSNRVPLKDWKPGDVELFASMGFSAANYGDEGYFMEEDPLPNSDLEGQKFTRRISRTKHDKKYKDKADLNFFWVLEKKNNDEPESSYKIEKIFSKLIGNEKNPGLLDYFDTLTDELTENVYLYNNTMRLKSILENLAEKESQLRQDVTTVSKHEGDDGATPVIQRGLSKEQKKMLSELVKEYNRYNEVLEYRKNLMEVAKKMNDIGELSEAYLTEKIHEGNTDENAWFEEKPIRKHVSEIKKLAVEFANSAKKCDQQLKEMQSMYQEAGMILERYFHME